MIYQDVTCKQSFFSQNPSLSPVPKPLPQLLLHSNNRGFRTRLDIPKLREAVLLYYQPALANSNHHSYKVAIKLYNSFCHSISHTPKPTSEYTILLLTAYLGQRNLDYSTIKVYLLALHVTAGMHQAFSGHLTPTASVERHSENTSSRKTSECVPTHHHQHHGQD